MYRLVLSTVSSADEARKIAHTLVEEKLAACVNILPQVESVYRWEGKVESALEFLLIIKTTAEGFAGLRDRLIALHSYEVPECISMDITAGSDPYLQWLSESVRS
jgi:periplasmic divalent cation tolerance protein